MCLRVHPYWHPLQGHVLQHYSQNLRCSFATAPGVLPDSSCIMIPSFAYLSVQHQQLWRWTCSCRTHQALVNYTGLM